MDKMLSEDQKSRLECIQNFEENHYITEEEDKERKSLETDYHDKKVMMGNMDVADWEKYMFLTMLKTLTEQARSHKMEQDELERRLAQETITAQNEKAQRLEAQRIAQAAQRAATKNEDTGKASSSKRRDSQDDVIGEMLEETDPLPPPRTTDTANFIAEALDLTFKMNNPTGSETTKKDASKRLGAMRSGQLMTSFQSELYQPIHDIEKIAEQVSLDVFQKMRIRGPSESVTIKCPEFGPFGAITIKGEKIYKTFFPPGTYFLDEKRNNMEITDILRKMTGFINKGRLTREVMIEKFQSLFPMGGAARNLLELYVGDSQAVGSMQVFYDECLREFRLKINPYVERAKLERLLSVPQKMPLNEVLRTIDMYCNRIYYNEDDTCRVALVTSEVVKSIKTYLERYYVAEDVSKLIHAWTYFLKQRGTSIFSLKACSDLKGMVLTEFANTPPSPQAQIPSYLLASGTHKDRKPDIKPIRGYPEKPFKLPELLQEVETWDQNETESQAYLPAEEEDDFAPEAEAVDYIQAQGGQGRPNYQRGYAAQNQMPRAGNGQQPYARPGNNPQQYDGPRYQTTGARPKMQMNTTPGFVKEEVHCYLCGCTKDSEARHDPPYYKFCTFFPGEMPVYGQPANLCCKGFHKPRPTCPRRLKMTQRPA